MWTSEHYASIISLTQCFPLICQLLYIAGNKLLRDKNTVSAMWGGAKRSKVDHLHIMQWLQAGKKEQNRHISAEYFY